jgi:hypothetical protein
MTPDQSVRNMDTDKCTDMDLDMDIDTDTDDMDTYTDMHTNMDMDLDVDMATFERTDIRHRIAPKLRYQNIVDVNVKSLRSLISNERYSQKSDKIFSQTQNIGCQ